MTSARPAPNTESITFGGFDGPLGEAGYAVVPWATSPDADARTREALTGSVDRAPVTRNPHLTSPDVQRAVTSPTLLARVTAALGPNIAVETTFLMVKEPGSDFLVPIHQDGVNDRLVLDPRRAIAAWLAITPACLVNGGLELAPGSHRDGYLPYGRSNAPGQPLGTLQEHAHPAEAARTFSPVALAAGHACLMDVRLLHRSGPNRGSAARVGVNVRYVAPGAIHHRSGPLPRLFPVAGTWPAMDHH